MGRSKEMAALKDDLAQLKNEMRSVSSDVESLSDKVTLVSEEPDKMPRAIPLASKPTVPMRARLGRQEVNPSRCGLLV